MKNNGQDIDTVGAPRHASWAGRHSCEASNTASENVLNIAAGRPFVNAILQIVQSQVNDRLDLRDAYSGHGCDAKNVLKRLARFPSIDAFYLSGSLFLRHNLLTTTLWFATFNAAHTALNVTS